MVRIRIVTWGAAGWHGHLAAVNEGRRGSIKGPIAKKFRVFGSV